MKLQDFKQFHAGRQIQPTRSQLVIPSFSLPGQSWLGASRLLLEYPIGNSNNFALRVPVAQFGENFVAAIRYVDDGTVVFRWKLFNDVDEILWYPVYAGETIGLGAVVEIWSVNTEDTPVLNELEILESSVLVFPSPCSVCCAVPGNSTLLVVRDPTIVYPYSYCDPFCLPISVG